MQVSIKEVARMENFCNDPDNGIQETSGHEIEPDGAYQAPEISSLGRAVALIRGACTWRNADQGVPNYYW